MRKIVLLVVLVAAMVARADYWMTFCKTPDGKQYSQVGFMHEENRDTLGRMHAYPDF